MSDCSLWLVSLDGGSYVPFSLEEQFGSFLLRILMHTRSQHLMRRLSKQPVMTKLLGIMSIVFFKVSDFYTSVFFTYTLLA